MKEVALGKITRVEVGSGGYQDAMFGVTIEVTAHKGGTSSEFKGHWNTEIGPSTKWTEGDREKLLGEVFNWLRLIMKEAKCKEVHELVGKPVEIVWVDMKLQSWRILKEVL